MDEIENILSSLTKSINQSIKDFTECKDLSQKKSQAEIIKLLCESMGVFFDVMNNAYLFDDIDMDDYHDDDEDHELETHGKAKKKIKQR